MIDHDHYLDLIRRAFAADGLLSRLMPGYAPNPVQLDYALAVGRSFLGDGDARGLLTALEGETGTGKTLGYLIPLTLFLGLAPGKKAIVSTYTLHLQSQIMGKDFPTAQAVAKELTGATITAAPRKGRQNFPSRSRIEAVRYAKDSAGDLSADDHDLFDRLVDHTDAGRDLLEWSAAGCPLPSKVTAADICLLPGMDGPEAGHYLAHLEASRDADIVIVTHALLMRSCLMWHAMLGKAACPADDGEDGDTTPALPPYDVAVIDEADTIPRAAESVFDHRVSVPMLSRIAHELERFGTGPLKTALDEWSAWMDARFAELNGDDAGRAFRQTGDGGTAILTDPALDPVRIEAAQWAAKISGILKKLATRAKKAGLPDDDVSDIRQLAVSLDQFADRCNETTRRKAAAKTGSATDCGDFAPVLRWSPVRAYPAFGTIPVEPGRLAGRLWQSNRDGTRIPYLRVVVFTSATLDAPGEAGGTQGAAPFVGFRARLGIIPEFHRYRTDLSARFTPAKGFGRLKMVLADRNVPDPGGNRRRGGDAQDDGQADTAAEVLSDPGWIGYAAFGIAEARKRGGRALVLLPSFRDVASIAAAARAHGVDVIEHRRGDRLHDLLPAFKESPDGVLMTAAGWEGLDLPGCLSHVIIPRIPFPSPDDARQHARQYAMETRGTMSSSDIRRLLFTIAMSDTRRKLRQGIGRLIRQKDDGGTLWILDPRFPLPHALATDFRLRQRNRAASHYALFANCIPDRFRSGIVAPYLSAEILMVPEKAGLMVAAE